MKVEWTNKDALTPSETTYQSKAILVIDEMPKRCLDCPLIWDEMNNDIVRCSNGRRLDENEDYIYKQKPSWCPLRPCPEKNTWDVTENGYVTEFAEGWNACLEEIEGETE